MSGLPVLDWQTDSCQSAHVYLRDNTLTNDAIVVMNSSIRSRWNYFERLYGTNRAFFLFFVGAVSQNDWNEQVFSDVLETGV